MKNIIRILERFLFNLKDFPKNLKYYFKNIIKWSPILWKDRDWDHYFIYEALRFINEFCMINNFLIFSFKSYLYSRDI